MGILYGVQATGQGHISRARAMAAALARHSEVDVTWLFSGRPRKCLFDMEHFGKFMHRRGLSFMQRFGSIDKLATLTSDNFARFCCDVFSLDVGGYDVIVSDFEPVTAWAGRLARIDTIGLGHHYAFHSDVPRMGDSLINRLIINWFAPVDLPLGLHWQPYGSRVLPPILDLPALEPAGEHYFLVYLPGGDQEAVTRLLNRFRAYRFVQYAPDIICAYRGNVARRSLNIDGFKRHLYRAAGVVCNSGFELISECLQLHKPVLTKPLGGQFEQLSNALALERAGYATVTMELGGEVLARWLAAPPLPPYVRFPDVTAPLAQWLADGATGSVEALVGALWRQTCQPPVDEACWQTPLLSIRGGVPGN